MKIFSTVFVPCLLVVVAAAASVQDLRREVNDNVKSQPEGLDDRELAVKFTDSGKAKAKSTKAPAKSDGSAGSDAADSGEAKKTKSSKASSDPSSSPSVTPSLAPSSSPSEMPSTSPAPSMMPSKRTDPSGDANAPKCEDITLISDDVTAFVGRASDSRKSEDANGNDVLDDGEDANGNGIIDVDTGIVSVELGLDSENLQLKVNPFSPGDLEVEFVATRIDDALNATGTVIATDGAGNTCELEVALEPFDQELFDLLLTFPSELHMELFGETSGDDVPTYNVTGMTEDTGTFGAVNEENIKFQIRVETIIANSSELTKEALQDANVEEMAFILGDNYTSFVFQGFFIFDGQEKEVVALAFTAAQLPDYSVIVIYDPADPENGLTDKDDVGPTRRALVEVMDSDADKALMIYSKADARALQGESCGNALGEAIAAFNCRPPDQLEVNNACVQAKNLAYSTAVAAAQGKFDLAIDIAQAAYKAAIIAINLKKIRNFARALIPCVLIGILSGPLGYALCAARALAICIAKSLALRLAAKAALELAKRNAEAILRAALAAACQALRAGLRTCLKCKKEPCDESSDCSAEEYPDPHFRTWNNDYYDFHGACDMIYIKNDLLDLHIRTERRGSWSGVSNAALRIGGETLEVLQNSTYFVNGGVQATAPQFIGGIYPFEASSSKFIVRLSGGQYIEFQAFRTNILVRVNAHGSDFFNSAGMSGTWNKFGLVGRDGNTTFRDTQAFAEEWEVDKGLGDLNLFVTPAVSACSDPPDPPVQPEPELLQQAEEACANLLEGQADRENCIFDVVAAKGDPEWAENPSYTDPLEATERCKDDTDQCASLGGECVWRCSPDQNLCEPGLCSEAIDLGVVDSKRRRLNTFVEGCSCALPLPDESDKESPSQSPSQLPSFAPTSSSKSKQSKKKDKKLRG